MAGLEHLDQDLLDQARVFGICLKKNSLCSVVHAGGSQDVVYGSEEGDGGCSFGILLES